MPKPSLPIHRLPENRRVVWGLIVLLGSAVFAWDITTPLGQIPWLLYVPIVLLTWWIPHRRAAFITAGVVSLLIVLDHFLSSPGVGPRISIFNRSLGISTIWIVAALVEVWKRTDESLQQSEHILHSFYNSAPMMMGIAKVEGGDIRPISVNAATARFLGAPPEAMHNRLASELGIPRETILEWIQRYRECVQTGSPVRFEYLHTTPAAPRRLAATVCHVSGAGPSAALSAPTRPILASTRPVMSIVERRPETDDAAWTSSGRPRRIHEHRRRLSHALQRVGKRIVEQSLVGHDQKIGLGNQPPLEDRTMREPGVGGPLPDPAMNADANHAVSSILWNHTRGMPSRLQ